MRREGRCDLPPCHVISLYIIDFFPLSSVFRISRHPFSLLEGTNFLNSTMIYYEVVRVHSVKEASVSLSSMLLQRLPRSSSLLLCIDEESYRLLIEVIESLKAAAVLVLPAETFQSLSAPLNECLSRLTEMSRGSPHWVFFTSLEMMIETSDFNRWRDTCQTYQDRYNVVGLYIPEMSDFSGIAFTIPCKLNLIVTPRVYNPSSHS